MGRIKDIYGEMMDNVDWVLSKWFRNYRDLDDGAKVSVCFNAVEKMIEELGSPDTRYSVEANKEIDKNGVCHG